MDTGRTTDVVRCRCFPIFLEDIATMWFTRLPMRSILPFSQLAKRFVERFNLHTTHLKDMMSLSNLFQGARVSLKDFLSRFNMTVMEVSNAKEDIVLMALIREVHPNIDLEDG